MNQSILPSPEQALSLLQILPPFSLSHLDRSAMVHMVNRSPFRPTLEQAESLSRRRRGRQPVNFVRVHVDADVVVRFEELLESLTLQVFLLRHLPVIAVK